MNIVNFAAENPALVVLPVMGGLLSWLLVWLKVRYISYGYIFGPPGSHRAQSTQVTDAERDTFEAVRQFWSYVAALRMQFDEDDASLGMQMRSAAVELLSAELELRKKYNDYRDKKLVLRPVFRRALRLSLRFSSFVYPRVVRALNSNGSDEYAMGRYALVKFARYLHDELRRAADKHSLEVEFSQRGPRAPSGQAVQHPVHG